MSAKPRTADSAAGPQPISAPTDARQTLTHVVDALCETYLEPALQLNHLRPSTLPNRAVVLELLRQIKDALFPDHRLNRQIRQGPTAYIIGGILEQIHEDLARQIHLARSYAWNGEGSCPDRPEDAAADAWRFLARLADVRRTLALDAQAAYDGDPAAKSYDEIIFCYPGFEAVATYRIAHELHVLDVPLLPRIMTEDAHSLTGVDIHPGATIGKSFFIDHATGVVIGETTIIGERVKLYQGVTLGALSFPKDEKGRLVRGIKRHPTIEDDVVIYAGATVLGGETVIGKGAVIGGSCWITRSIPPGTKVVLSDPQMKMKSGKSAVETDSYNWSI